MKPTRKAPTIDSVTTINPDGSRYFVHPADVRGFFTRWRRVTALLLIVVYVALPIVPINGKPAVFLDVLHRKLHLFGTTLMFQDIWLLFFLITGLGFGLFLVTSIVGRIWCGWACPQTVFLDHVFRRVERWIEGDSPARRKLDAAPWSPEKIFKRVLKHGVFVALSLAMANVFLSYFVSLPGLYQMMKQSPTEHWGAFLFAVTLAGLIYFNFAWFREQFCIAMCPYGRLQSALIDDNSIVIGYDAIRGEPRGKPADDTGDCVDCRRCVQVCPTGIDIRQGLQMECISCAACIDVCDEVMDRLDRPRGLIRHESLNALSGKASKFWRPRLFIYMALSLLGASVFLMASREVKPITVSVLRMQGAPYFRDASVVRNNFFLHIANKRSEPHEYKIETQSDNPNLQVVGKITSGIRLDGGEEVQEPLILTVPDKEFRGKFDVRINILNRGGKIEAERTVPFLGPYREGS